MRIEHETNDNTVTISELCDRMRANYGFKPGVVQSVRIAGHYYLILAARSQPGLASGNLDAIDLTTYQKDRLCADTRVRMLDAKLTLRDLKQ